MRHLLARAFLGMFQAPLMLRQIVGKSESSFKIRNHRTGAAHLSAMKNLSTTSSETQAFLQQATLETVEDDITQDMRDLEKHVITVNKAQYLASAAAEDVRAQYKKRVEAAREALATEAHEKEAREDVGHHRTDTSEPHAHKSKPKSGAGMSDSTAGTRQDEQEEPVKGTEEAASGLSADGRAQPGLSAYLAKERDARERELNRLRASPDEKEKALANYDRSVDETRHIDALLHAPASPSDHLLSTLANNLEKQVRENPGARTQAALSLLQQLGDADIQIVMRDLSTRLQEKERTAKSQNLGSIERHQAMSAIQCLRNAVIHVHELRRDMAVAQIHLPNLNREALQGSFLRPEQATLGSLNAALGKPTNLSAPQNARFYRILEKHVDALPVTSWAIENMEQRQRLLSELRAQSQAVYSTAARPEQEGEEKELRNRLVKLLSDKQRNSRTS